MEQTLELEQEREFLLPSLARGWPLHGKTQLRAMPATQKIMAAVERQPEGSSSDAPVIRTGQVFSEKESDGRSFSLAAFVSSFACSHLTEVQ